MYSDNSDDEFIYRWSKKNIIAHEFWTCNTSTLFFVSSALHFQSCHDEEEDGEEVKSFEVGEQSVSQVICLCPGCGSLASGWSSALLLCLKEKEMEKQKLLYQQARLHERGAAEMVLQTISASKGGSAECLPWWGNSLSNRLVSSQAYAVFVHACVSRGWNLRKTNVVLFLWSGEMGPMVASTLKLGIAILNGGNSTVQQVAHCSVTPDCTAAAFTVFRCFL